MKNKRKKKEMDEEREKREKEREGKERRRERASLVRISERKINLRVLPVSSEEDFPPEAPPCVCKGPILCH